MPRRASSSAHPVWTLLIFLLVVAAGAGGWWVWRLVGDPFRTLTPLAITEYLENSNTLRGNIYKITGTVGSKLAWASGAGSLYAVTVESGTQSDPLPVLVPVTLSGVNIQKGQRFHFRVSVDEHGVLVVEDLKKA